MNKINLLLLILIVLFSFILRVYKIDVAPSSLTWDETAVGYNAFTIANFGREEYGTFLPLVFRSFGEGKQPVHIYITAFFVKMLGLSEFSTRLPSAIFGSLNVLLIFYLSKVMFNNNLIAYFSSFFLAISPQNLFFSRFNHEANFALFFFMLGFLTFCHSFRWKILLPLSFLLFILSMVSYNAAKIVIPLLFVLLIISYFGKIKANKVGVFIILFLLLGSVTLIAFKPQLLGLTRYNQTLQGDKELERTFVFRYTNSHLLGRVNLVLTQYFWHFDPKYLFFSGGKNPRLSSQGSGEFYPIDAPFLLLGVLYLLYKRSKVSFLILGWGLLGPLPSSLFAEAPHAGRAAFMMGSWHIISAVGVYYFLHFLKKKILKVFVLTFILIIFSLYTLNFLNNYFQVFIKQYAIDWQYGMKQVVDYTKDHSEYFSVKVTDIRSQPYIFFLYYLKFPLPDYLSTVIFNKGEVSSFNNVASFDRYSFGGLSGIEEIPPKGVLYVLSPSEYDGLKLRHMYDVKKVIFYPNGTDAFYIVSAK